MGCMKLVGEAFRENGISINESKKVSVVSIASWTTTRGNDELIIGNVRM